MEQRGKGILVTLLNETQPRFFQVADFVWKIARIPLL